MLEIKKFTLDHLEALAKLYVTCYKETYQEFFSPEFLATKNIESAYQIFQDTQNQNILLLFLDQELIGFCGYGKARDNQSLLEIYGFYLLPNKQHQGYGTYLLNYLFSCFSKQNFLVWCLEANQKALNFYLKNGFKLTNTHKPYANQTIVALKRL